MKIDRIGSLFKKNFDGPAWHGPAVMKPNFPPASDWNTALTKLKEIQVKLIASLKTFPEYKLFTAVPSCKNDFYTLLHGIVQHDIYHLRQIAFLKK